MTAMTDRQSTAPDSPEDNQPMATGRSDRHAPDSGQAPRKTVPHPGPKRKLRCESGAMPAIASRKLTANLSTGTFCPRKMAGNAER